VLVTTHYLDEAERCDRVAIVHAGRLAALGTTRELKTAFQDRPIVEVRAAEPVRAMTVLDGLPAVEKTSLFGTAVHAVLRGASISVDSVRSALTAAGVAVTSIGPVVPSLEDVFIDVVDRAVDAGAE
jgi:drug efflux transport system ATP-binding protein